MSGMSDEPKPEEIEQVTAVRGLDGCMNTLAVEPMSYCCEDEIGDERGCSGSVRGGRWRPEEDVALDQEHQYPKDRRPKAADDIDGCRPLQIHDHSPEQKHRFQGESNRRIVPESQAHLHRVVV